MRRLARSGNARVARFGLDRHARNRCRRARAGTTGWKLGHLPMLLVWDAG
jgi:hypothetical protein